MDSLAADAVPSRRRRHSSNGGLSSPLLDSRSSFDAAAFRHRRKRRWHIIPRAPRARRTFGMMLLGVVVVLWVSSNFLTYTIFSDDSYSKPYFVTYVNTATFCLYLAPVVVRWGVRRAAAALYGGGGKRKDGAGALAEEGAYVPIASGGDDDDDDDEEEAQKQLDLRDGDMEDVEDKLTMRQTMRLSAEFCLLWFIANYFGSYCFKYTSVASATILSSTSSMFTLLLGSLMRVERFTYTKLLSVVASLVGIALISTTDLHPSSPSPSLSSSSSFSSSSPSSRTPLQILLGDALALLSALSYGLYIVLLKSRVGSEARVHMPLFFGFVGLFNVLFLWPGLLVLHLSGQEPFALPRSRDVAVIVAVNAAITLTSDFCWAYAMLLTSPLVVTVGLSLTIPLALLGQMALYGTVAGLWYWLGAACVFVAFWFLNREEKVDEATAAAAGEAAE